MEGRTSSGLLVQREDRAAVDGLERGDTSISSILKLPFDFF